MMKSNVKKKKNSRNPCSPFSAHRNATRPPISTFTGEHTGTGSNARLTHAKAGNVHQHALLTELLERDLNATNRPGSRIKEWDQTAAGCFTDACWDTATFNRM